MTTPTQTAAPSTSLTSYVTFIKAHETLIIVVLAAFLLFRTGQGIENLWINHDNKAAVKAATVVTVDTTANKALADQLAQAKLAQQQQAQQLDQSMTAKLAALQQQQAADSKMTQQQILDRWVLLQPMKPGAVQTNGATDTITPQAATQTVQALEKIPVLESDINDLNQELVSDSLVIVRQSDLVTGLNQQITDEKKSHTDDVKLEKAKQKTSWLHGFKWGVIVGAVGTEVIRVGIGRP
jgi:hypothetical protein